MRVGNDVGNNKSGLYSLLPRRKIRFLCIRTTVHIIEFYLQTCDYPFVKNKRNEKEGINAKYRGGRK
jgi:hypothetical protein